ncbi:mannonate dehydratase [Puniceibacterium sp. IMCC21224]|uniref:mannonate dehydratase n=1 Tax=Puniceibacterium sp. IMCC21224 TaxID=1618204 RepID=UPI00064DBF5C|nr:mannonate dehydratase [Puniceibacterium sp. IMCC21224]KMK66410.1 D-mannonate dehydratase [Puniceibacterium sp. IMCC21224]
MIESWRWYGPFDPITLPEVAQTGAAGIVHALHEVPYGEVWTNDAIAARKAEITGAGFTWDVAESLPIHEAVKRGEGDLSTLFANYRQSMANLAANGIRTICYNFMPLLDWTRTDLRAPLARGGSCLRFDASRMAAFEIHMLGRAGAEDEYSQDVRNKAAIWFQQSSESDREALLHAIMSGLPGAFDRYDIAGLRDVLQSYEGIDRDTLRANYKRFLQEVVPAAEDLGMVFCVHPDDPPRDILGLPRIVSDGDDIDWILSAVDSPANGLTLCSGSLGANPANDVPAIAARFANKIRFGHLRNVRKEPDGSFEEAAHLEGDTDMVALADVFVTEEARRREAGEDFASIPVRPDHGHEILSDIGAKSVPGYPMIGRLRGLAELRGVFRALEYAATRG